MLIEKRLFNINYVAYYAGVCVMCHVVIQYWHVSFANWNSGWAEAATMFQRVFKILRHSEIEKIESWLSDVPCFDITLYN
jgi:hypothetical protein